MAGLATSLVACGGSDATGTGASTATTRSASSEVRTLPATLDASRAWEVCALGNRGTQEELQAAYYRGRGASLLPVYAPSCDLGRPWARISVMGGTSRVVLTGRIAEVRIRPA